LDKTSLIEVTMKSHDASRRELDGLEGLMLCLLLAVTVDPRSLQEEMREIVLIALQEPEFANLEAGEFEEILEHAQRDLHRGPDALVATIAKRLDSQELRTRGLELAVRVVTSDGIVTPDQQSLVENLARGLGLSRDSLDASVLSAQRRLVRFMMLYLVYLTAISDGEADAEEFEEMLPFALSLPAFGGMTTAEYAFMSHSVRRNLSAMAGDDGLDYIAGTLLKAAELLGDSTLPEQAVRLVARGLFSNGDITESERSYFLAVVEKLGLGDRLAQEIMAGTGAE